MILYILGTIVALLVAVVFVIRSSFKPPKGGAVKLVWKDRHSLPSLLSRIPLILVGAMFKKEGRFYPGLSDFPETHIEVGASEMEVAHLQKYYKVCGFEKPKEGEALVVPPCYPVMAIFNFQPFLVSMPSFPVSPLGVIHVRTVVTQHKELVAGTKLTYAIDMAGHKMTERGREVDFVIKASLESGEVVWMCAETMLSRVKKSGGAKKNTDAAAKPEEPAWDGSSAFSVAENTGRSYASVVGDYNPHHMHAIPAKLFGFKRAIAHGQWSLEHCIARLQNEAGIVARPPFKLDCSFKLPIFMPGKCLLRWHTSGAPKHDSVTFELRSEDGKLPHLAGKLENLDRPGTLE